MIMAMTNPYIAIASASATKIRALVLTSGFSTTAAIAAAPDCARPIPAPAAARPKAIPAAKNFRPASETLLVAEVAVEFPEAASAVGAKAAATMKKLKPRRVSGKVRMT